MMRVLYCSAGGVGNVVMSTPAMQALAELGHEVAAYLPERSARVAQLLRGWDALAGIVTGRRPRAGLFDMAVHSVWSFERGFCTDERTAGAVDLSTTHEAEADMIPVRELGYTGAMPPAHVETALPERTQRSQRVPSSVLSVSSVAHSFPYWVFAPGCNPDPMWERKRWGGWAALAEELEGTAVFLGAEGDLVGKGGSMKDEGGSPVHPSSFMLHPSVLDLTGRTTLREAASVIARARACIAIDCGLAHVAAALGVPTVVLFGATSETKNLPLGPRVRLMTLDLPCRPCQMTPRWDECVKWRCMAFGPEDVAAAGRAAT